MSEIRATKHSLNESNNIKLDILDERVELKTNLSSKILPAYSSNCGIIEKSNRQDIMG